VFVKPHANNEKVQDMVREALLAKSIRIMNEGDISGTEIDEKKLIDQHYYAIASKATLLDPKDLVIPESKFQDFFGESWSDVLSTNRAANAMQACDRFGIDATGLEKAWRDCEPLNKVVKFGGGFYCGLVTHGGESLYVFNAFFMSMRGKFTDPTTSIHWYEVEFDESVLKWEDFRGVVLGPTDPSEAPIGSIRRTIYEQWDSGLGLESQPNKGDNGVHASASPLEGLAERMNWMGRKLEEDNAFGKLLLEAGIPAEVIQAWSVDPRVTLPGTGGDGSLFDALEDMDVGPCLEKCVAIHDASK